MQSGQDIPTLTSAAGLTARFSPYGARLLALTVPDAEGRLADVVMGHATAEEFAAGDIYAGAVCGRYANRIGQSRFAIDGEPYRLRSNEGGNHLHGGPDGFHNRLWTLEAEEDGLGFSLASPEGDQGYPGAFGVRAVYRLKGRVLSLSLEAEATRPTVVNLTQHAYWNLAGEGTIADHLLTLAADGRTAIDAAKIPTGEIAGLERSAYDFRQPRPLREALDRLPDGLDDNYCLRGGRGALKRAAILEGGGRRMEVWTTEPGLQAYTAAHFGPSLIGKGGRPQQRFGAIALEPQNYPNAPNIPHFPNAVLRPGETYRHRIEWRFSAM